MEEQLSALQYRAAKFKMISHLRTRKYLFYLGERNYRGHFPVRIGFLGGKNDERTEYRHKFWRIYSA